MRGYFTTLKGKANFNDMAGDYPIRDNDTLEP